MGLSSLGFTYCLDLIGADFLNQLTLNYLGF